MSVARYSREVTLDDLENVHTFAVLATPPGSHVLDLGAGDGSVAQALAARGCAVTAVERDKEGVAALEARGILVLEADLDALGSSPLPRQAFDVILLLDVIEHLVDPQALLARVPEWLAPGGRILVSVPNVAHAAVRLALLQGRFSRTATGLLDRTHLQFFDRDGLEALLASAGLHVVDLLTVERELHETEIAIETQAFRSEVVAAATADPASRVYQYFVVTRPGEAVPADGGLLQALQGRVRSIEASYRLLETHASRLHAELLVTREHLDDKGTAAERLSRHGIAHTMAPRDPAQAQHDDADDIVADRDTLRRQLRERVAELQQASDTIDVLLKDLDVQRGFAAALAAQVPRIAARGGEAEVLSRLEAYEAVARTPQDARAHADVAEEFRRLQGAVAFRGLARLDAALRRVPRLRTSLRGVVRALTFTR